MTPNDFRRIALGQRDAVESSHMDHPDFRAEGKIFATLHADMKWGMVKLTPEDQQRFVREFPDVFQPESGAWGRQGCTAVKLAAVDEETLGEAMTLARRNVGARANRSPSATHDDTTRRRARRSVGAGTAKGRRKMSRRK
jgi:hypothetical protein